MAWSLVQKTATPASGAAGSIAVTLPAGSAAGTLLVCCLTANSNAAWSGPAGWVQGPDVTNGTVNQATVFYYIGNPGGISSATFTNAGTVLRGEMGEFSPGAGMRVALNAAGTGTAGAVATCTATTTGAANGGDLGVCCFNEHNNTNITPTWTDPSGWTLLGSVTTATSNALYSAYDLSVPTGTLSVTATSSVASAVATGWTGVVATFTAVPARPVMAPVPRRQPARARVGTALCAAGILAAAAVAQAPPVPAPPSRPPPVIQHAPPHRAIPVGRGILAKTTLSPQPTAVFPLPPPPPIGHPAPHRALARGTLAPPPLAHLTAPLPPTAISPRPPHRALAKGVLAATTLSPQPSRVPPPLWHQPNAPRPPHRALWRVIAGPAPAVAAVTSVSPARPGPVTNRPTAPHRAVARWLAGKTTLSAQPASVPPPAWHPQPRTPAPHRVLWRAQAAPATQPLPASRLPQQPRRPGPHGAIWRRVAGPQPPALVPAVPSRPQPSIQHAPAHRAAVKGVLAPAAIPHLTAALPPTAVSPRPPHRALARGVLAPAPPALAPVAVPAARPPRQPPRRAPGRALWRVLTGRPGPAVTGPGTVTAADRPANTVTAADLPAFTVTAADRVVPVIAADRPAATVTAADRPANTVTAADSEP